MKAPMRYTICFIFLDFNLLFYFSSKPFCLYTSVSDDHGIADVKLNITVINGIIQIKRIAIFVAPAVLFSLGNKFSGTTGCYSGSLRCNGTLASSSKVNTSVQLRLKLFLSRDSCSQTMVLSERVEMLLTTSSFSTY